MSFDEWIGKVDAFLIAEIGLSHMDMEDWLWYDAYESGMKPEDEAKEFLYEQGVYLD